MKNVQAFKAFYGNKHYVGNSYEDWCKLPSEDLTYILIYAETDSLKQGLEQFLFVGEKYYTLDKKMTFSTQSRKSDKKGAYQVKSSELSAHELNTIQNNNFDNVDSSLDHVESDKDYILKRRGRS